MIFDPTTWTNPVVWTNKEVQINRMIDATVDGDTMSIAGSTVQFNGDGSLYLINGDDFITITDSVLNAADGYWAVNMGTEDDELTIYNSTINANIAVGTVPQDEEMLISDVLTQISDNDTINISSGSKQDCLVVLASGKTISSGIGADTVNIGGTFRIGENAKLDTGYGDDSITVTWRLENSGTIDMGDGDDTFTVLSDMQVNGADGAKITLGGGTDTLVINRGALLQQASFDFGAGFEDKLEINGGTFTSSNVTGLENIVVQEHGGTLGFGGATVALLGGNSISYVSLSASTVSPRAGITFNNDLKGYGVIAMGGTSSYLDINVSGETVATNVGVQAFANVYKFDTSDGNDNKVKDVLLTNNFGIEGNGTATLYFDNVNGTAFKAGAMVNATLDSRVVFSNNTTGVKVSGGTSTKLNMTDVNFFGNDVAIDVSGETSTVVKITGGSIFGKKYGDTGYATNQGIVFADGSATVRGTTFGNNHNGAVKLTDASFVGGSLSFFGSMISDEEAPGLVVSGWTQSGASAMTVVDTTGAGKIVQLGGTVKEQNQYGIPTDVNIGGATFTRTIVKGDVYGGALNIQGGTFRGTDLVFDRAQAEKNGGAVYVANNDNSVAADVVMNNVLFYGNTAGVFTNETGTTPPVDPKGGALYVAGGKVTLNGATFTDNMAAYATGTSNEWGMGGAIYVADGELIYNVTENITNAGNTVARKSADLGDTGTVIDRTMGGFLYAAGGTTTFNIASAKTLTIGESDETIIPGASMYERGKKIKHTDSIDGYGTIVVNGGTTAGVVDNGTMVVYGSVGESVKWEVKAGELDLLTSFVENYNYDSTKKEDKETFDINGNTINLSNFKLGTNATLKLSTADDIINLSGNVAVSGASINLNGAYKGDKLNLNGNTLTYGHAYWIAGSGVSPIKALETAMLTVDAGMLDADVQLQQHTGYKAVTNGGGTLSLSGTTVGQTQIATFGQDGADGAIRGTASDDLVVLSNQVSFNGAIALGEGSDVVQLLAGGTIAANGNLTFKVGDGTTTLKVGTNAKINVTHTVTDQGIQKVVTDNAITVDFVDDTAAATTEHKFDLEQTLFAKRLVVTNTNAGTDTFYVELSNNEKSITIYTEADSKVTLQTKRENGWADDKVFTTKADMDGALDTNGNYRSDVMFQWVQNASTPNQIGYWLNGKDTWYSANGDGMGRSTAWKVIGSYDMDSNGKADAVYAGEVNNTCYLAYYKDGNTTNAGYTSISGEVQEWDGSQFVAFDSTQTHKYAVANMTGNAGKNSIIIHNADSGTLIVWKDSVAATDSSSVLSTTYNNGWTLAGTGDFDGDGKAECLMRVGETFAYATLDLGYASASICSGWTADWEVSAIGDFTGDGKDDIILFHRGTKDSEGKYTGTGAMVRFDNGQCATSTDYTTVGQLDVNDWFVCGAGDYNGDGKDDLLVRQYTTGMLGYYASGDVSQWVEMGRGVSSDWQVIA